MAGKEWGISPSQTINFVNATSVRLPTLQLTTRHSQRLNSEKPLGTMSGCGQSQREQTGRSHATVVTQLPWESAWFINASNTNFKVLENITISAYIR